MSIIKINELLAFAAAVCLNAPNNFVKLPLVFTRTCKTCPNLSWTFNWIAFFDALGTAVVKSGDFMSSSASGGVGEDWCCCC